MRRGPAERRRSSLAGLVGVITSQHSNIFNGTHMSVSIPALNATAEYLLQPPFYLSKYPTDAYIATVKDDERLTEDLRKALLLNAEAPDARGEISKKVAELRSLDIPEALRRLITVRLNLLDGRSAAAEIDYRLLLKERIETDSGILNLAVTESAKLLAVDELMSGEFTDKFDENLELIRRMELDRDPIVLSRIVGAVATTGKVSSVRRGEVGALAKLDPLIGPLRDPGAPDWAELKAKDAAAADRLALLLALLESYDEDEFAANAMMREPNDDLRVMWSLLHKDDVLWKHGGATFELLVCAILTNAVMLTAKGGDYERLTPEIALEGEYALIGVAPAFRADDVMTLQLAFQGLGVPLSEVLDLPCARKWPLWLKRFVRALDEFVRINRLMHAAVDTENEAARKALVDYSEACRALVARRDEMTATAKNTKARPSETFECVLYGLLLSNAYAYRERTGVDVEADAVENVLNAALRSASRRRKDGPKPSAPYRRFLQQRVNHFLEYLLFAYMPDRTRGCFPELTAYWIGEALEPDPGAGDLAFSRRNLVCGGISDVEGRQYAACALQFDPLDPQTYDQSLFLEYTRLVFEYFGTVASRPVFAVPGMPWGDQKSLVRAKAALSAGADHMNTRAIDALLEELRRVQGLPHPELQPILKLEHFIAPFGCMTYAALKADKGRGKHLDMTLARYDEVKCLLDQHLHAGRVFRNNFDWYAPMFSVLGKTISIAEYEEFEVAIVERDGHRMMVTIGFGDEMARLSRLQKRALPEYHEELAAPVPEELSSVDIGSEEISVLMMDFHYAAETALKGFEQDESDRAKPFELAGEPVEFMELRHLRREKNERKVKKPGSKKGPVKIIPAEYGAPKVRLKVIPTPRYSD